MCFMGDASQLFQCVQKKSGRGSQQIRGLSGDDFTVGQFHGSSRCTGLFCAIQGSTDNLTILWCDMCLLHQQFQLEDFVFFFGTIYQSGLCLIIPADDFLTGSLLAYLIIDDTISSHIDPHVCRRFVRAFTENPFKHGFQYREDFHITIVIDCSFSVSFQTERVDHIDIVQISCGSFVCQINRMLQRNIPDRECLKLRITGTNTTFLLMVQLRQAGSHLSASRTRSCDNNQRTSGFDVIILSRAFVTDNMRNIIWISVNGIKNVYRDI